MKRREQPIAGPIPGEDATGAISAVRRRREADDDEARMGVAEAGQRTRPVALPGEAPGRVGSRRLPPGDQPRAAAAGLDLEREGA
jgi:hypothetical protein